MTTVFPGERISATPTDTTRPCPGTYNHQNILYASLHGTLTTTPSLSVTRTAKKVAVPTLNAIVTGRIIRINPRYATLDILTVGSLPCKEPFQGIIRSQDVRAHQKDSVKIFNCFRPGDGTFTTL